MKGVATKGSQRLEEFKEMNIRRANEVYVWLSRTAYQFNEGLGQRE